MIERIRLYFLPFLVTVIGVVGCLLMLPAHAADKPAILEEIKMVGEVGGAIDAADIAKQVEAITENQRVKAVFVTVNSPGGGVLESAAIYEELSKIKVPVVVWCDQLCASGGEFIAMSPSVQFIAVRDGTLCGSIGVIMHVTRYYRLLDWAKIDAEVYKSGRKKDEGSGSRAPDDQEKADLQATIAGLAGDFYARVEKARGEKVKPHMADIKNAGIYFGAECVKVGLADAVMTKEQAMKKAKELSGATSIFSRSELKKMSKDADDGKADNSIWTGSNDGPLPQAAVRALGDLHYLVDLVKEIHGGASAMLEYRMPYSL